MVSAGKRLLPRASFASDTLEATSAPYDLVMASGSLHYEEVWRPTFKVLASTAHPWFYVTRLPIVHHADDFVVTQRAHAYGYPTAYPGWILNREHFLQLATGCSLSLEREFLIDERPTVPGAPEQPEYRGFLFRRDDAQ